jgi:hypothetical protein
MPAARAWRTRRSWKKDARFREVFLVAERSNGQRVYLPLQQLLLLETFFLFIKACETFPGASDGGADLQLADVIPLFVHVERDLSMDLKVVSLEGCFHAMYRGCAATVDDSGVTIRDFRDRSLPTAVALLPPLRFGTEALSAFVDHYTDMKTANRFSTALWVDAGGRD